MVYNDLPFAEEVEDDLMELHIREAVASDYDSLCVLFEETDALHRENLPHIFQKPEGPVRDEEYILGLISDKNAALFIAQIGREPVGAICVIVKESPAVPIFVPRRYAVIDNLVVKGSVRRRGIGRALMKRAERWVRAQGMESIELNVWEFNQDAIEFYRKVGYETASRKMSKWLK